MTKDISNPKPLKMQDEAFGALERIIVTGELKPGQWVSETDLIEVSGHTRASVRSAVQRLSNEGLLKIVPRKGAQVCPIDYAQQFRSLELRRPVEVLVARAAAKRATPEQREVFKSIAIRYGSSAMRDDQAEMTDNDTLAFATMLEAADNEFASRALTSVKGLSRRFWILHLAEHGDVKRMVSAHAQVADAIANGDQDKAEAAVHTLIDYVEEFTLEVIGYSKGSKSND